MNRQSIISIALAVSMATSAHAQLSRAPQANDFKPIPGSMELSGMLLAKVKVGRSVALVQSQLLESIPQTRIAVIRVPEGSSELSFAKRLYDTGAYEYVRPNWRVYPARVPNDPLFPQQWHHNKIQTPRAWDLLTGRRLADQPMIIAVCDTGVDTNHPDLQPILVGGFNAPNDQAQVAGGDVEDISTSAHGTKVTGMAAAIGDNSTGVTGIGWNFNIMPIKITNQYTPTALFDDIIRGARWAAQHGAKIVNVSYDGANSDEMENLGFELENDYGTLLVMSAGNNSNEMTTDRPHVIIVGSTNSNDGRAATSNYGAALDCTAPGEAVRTTHSDGAYAVDSGTSFAAPVVAGTLALVWSLDRSSSPTAVRNALFESCTDLGAPGRDDLFGHGRVNVYRAVNNLYRFSLRALPFLPTAFDRSEASHMNNASESTGKAWVNGNPIMQAVKWSGASMINLGSLAGYPNSSGLGINDIGQVVGIAWVPGGSDIPDAIPFFWNGTHMLALNRPPGLAVCQASSINNSGQIVGDCRNPGLGYNIPYYWSSWPDDPIQLNLDGFPGGHANAIDDAGRIYGYVSNGIVSYPVCWTRFDLPPIRLANPQGILGAATASNGQTTVGAMWNPPGREHAVMWQNSVLRYLDEGGAFASQALSINTDGVICGGRNMYPGGPDDYHGVIWQNGFLVDINNRLAPDSTDWQVHSNLPAIQISNSGEILGTGYLNGVRRGFVATPTSTYGGNSSLTVNCSVLFGDYVGNNVALPVTFTMTRAVDGVSEAPVEANMNPVTGLFEVPNPNGLRGQFNIRAWSSHFLIRQATVMLTNMGAVGADFALINGDCDNDNEVGPGDFGILSAAFGSVDGDPNWDPNAELDGDGEVGPSDFGILSANFGMAGD